MFGVHHIRGDKVGLRHGGRCPPAVTSRNVVAVKLVATIEVWGYRRVGVPWKMPAWWNGSRTEHAMCRLVA